MHNDARRKNMPNNNHILPVELKCPACGKTFSYQLHTIADTQDEPEAEQNIFTGKYFETVCPHCQHETKVIHTLVYHDAESSLLIVLAEKDSDYREMKKILMSGTVLPEIKEWMQSCRVRIVKSEYELVEKLLMGHAELDDRVVEMARYEIFQTISPQIKDLSKLIFNVNPQEYFFIIFTNEEPLKKTVILTREFYEAVKEKYPDAAKDESTYEINEKWAKKYYRREPVINVD